MPAACSDLRSASVLNCGLRRERGMVRISTNALDAVRLEEPKKFLDRPV